MSDMKVCKTCNIEQPATTDYYYARPNGTFKHTCKLCARVKMQEHYRLHKPKYAEKSKRYAENNKERIAELNKEYDKKRKDDPVTDYRRFITDIASKFKLTVLEYRGMFDKQQGACAICGRPLICWDGSKSDSHRPAIDHDHNTGKVRGLLCLGCNTGIGSLNDDVTLLKKAIDYLNY